MPHCPLDGLDIYDGTLISRKLLNEGDLWADLLFWESMEGPQKAAAAENANPVIKEYLSFIGKVSFHRHFMVEKSY